MKRIYHFPHHAERVRCMLPEGRLIELPVIPGILKHPAPGELRELLQDNRVARKYTRLALRHTAWPVLKQFPREWLLECIDSADLAPPRKEAILYLIS